MNRKKWLTAVAIVTILAAAFFWGGDFQKKPITTSDTLTEATNLANDNEESESTIISEDSEMMQEVEVVDDPVDSDDSIPVDDVVSGNMDSTGSIEPKATDAASNETKQEVETELQTNSDDGLAKPTTTPKVKPTTIPTATPKATVAPSIAEKEKYQTDPVPPGKPKPVEWQDVEIDKKQELTVTLSVSAATILNNLNIFNEDKLEVLPKDGIIYAAKKVVFYEGESVFDVLLREMKANKIHMEFEMTPIYNSNYIEGINNLYEFDCGELSGWMYKVNGWFPNYGASRYALQDGDIVDWIYTCDLGRDVGGYVAVAGDKQ